MKRQTGMHDGDVDRPNATELAYRTIRADILSGRLVEGERLTEARLSEELKLSRTPVREAIGRLLLEGFLERQGGYTTRVARFAEDEIQQVYELRRLIECYAVRRAARLAGDDDIGALRAIHAEMAADTPPRDEAARQRLVQANEAFHRQIVTAARSPRLMALMTLVFDMGMVAHTDRKFAPQDLERSLRHHDELISAIEARAPDWAEALMSTHLLAGAARVGTGLSDPPAGNGAQGA